MPTAITHRLLAERVFSALPTQIQEKISDASLYYLGAQGPDVLFCLRPFGKDNLGKALHTEETYRFFRILLEESRRRQGVFSYACGYITHYCADVCFHPDIYERMGEKNRILFHHAMEHAYDGVFLEKYGGGKTLFFYRLKPPKDVSLTGVCEALGRYAAQTGRLAPSEEALHRAIGLYYFFSNRRTPLYRKKYAVRADEFFCRSRDESVRLIGRFFFGKVERADFGKHFLTGGAG